MIIIYPLLFLFLFYLLKIILFFNLMIIIKGKDVTPVSLLSLKPTVLRQHTALQESAAVIKDSPIVLSLFFLFSSFSFSFSFFLFLSLSFCRLAFHLFTLNFRLSFSFIYTNAITSHRQARVRHNYSKLDPI